MFNKKKGCAIIETAHPLYLKSQQSCMFLLSVNDASVRIEEFVFVQTFFILVHRPVAHAHA